MNVGDPIADVAVLVLAYRGDRFHGFAAQPEVKTVAGVLSDAIQRRCGIDPSLEVAGRTDAGVHATGQVVSFPASTLALRRVPLERLRRGLNRDLNPVISIRSAHFERAPFSARFDAKWRRYKYRLKLDGVIDVLEAHREWTPRWPVNVDLMTQASRAFVGQHDFASFCRVGPPGSTTQREVVRLDIEPLSRGVHGDESPRVDVAVTGTAFCWQMVRSIVGTLVDVGRGAVDPASVPQILAARDRSAAGQIAPPEGLVLDAVGYQHWSSESVI
ncbi:MAG: tRNA pseudouridine(38-40) synthase TruA [Acidimicrobiia bacterium]|nr:tRNA pseudouridine(38-40) synthase TruA [Acidimicrobiia bacterium]